jgi:hypothetical protein
VFVFQHLSHTLFPSPLHLFLCYSLSPSRHTVCSSMSPPR